MTILIAAAIFLALTAVAPIFGTDSTDITTYDERVRPRCSLLCAERA